MLLTDTFFRFSWPSLSGDIQHYTPLLQRFLQGVAARFPSLSLTRYNRQWELRPFRPTARVVASMLRQGTVLPETSVAQNPHSGFIVYFALIHSEARLPFTFMAGGGSDYLQDTLTCTPNVTGERGYRYPLPEAEFVALCTYIVEFWSPSRGLYTFRELYDEMGCSPTHPESEVGLLTYLSPAKDRATKRPDDLQVLVLGKGLLVWIAQSVLDRGHGPTRQFLQAATRFLSSYIFHEKR